MYKAVMRESYSHLTFYQQQQKQTNKKKQMKRKQNNNFILKNPTSSWLLPITCYWLFLWNLFSVKLESRSWHVLDTTLCDKVCQWLATGLWFSPVSSTNRTGHHDITEIFFESGIKFYNPYPLPYFKA